MYVPLVYLLMSSIENASTSSSILNISCTLLLGDQPRKATKLSKASGKNPLSYDKCISKN